MSGAEDDGVLVGGQQFRDAMARLAAPSPWLPGWTAQAVRGASPPGAAVVLRCLRYAAYPRDAGDGRPRSSFPGPAPSRGHGPPGETSSRYSRVPRPAVVCWWQATGNAGSQLEVEMTVRTGAQFLEGLRQRPRDVWLSGARVSDVTGHPALRRPLAQLARLYDMQHDPELAALLVVQGPNGPVARAFDPPRSAEDLRTRRRAFRVREQATLGLMGRTPDFMNTAVLALADSRELFARLAPRYADNVTRYYEYVRDNDLLLTHALIPPPNDRSRPASGQQRDFLHMGVVEENGDGLVLRGARMLATLAPVADELVVYSPPVLRPGDEPQAAVFAVPMDTPGLRLLCREPFDDGTRDSFDHPLASRFEEVDALVIFNDVLVPWDRVFLHGDVGLSNAVHFATSLRQFASHQGGVRGLVKMELVAGVAMRLAQAAGIDGFPGVRQKLGECLAAVEEAKALLVAAEAECETSESGTVRPKLAPMQVLRAHLARQYPRVVETLQVLGGGGLLMMPGAADIVGGAAGDVDTYYGGAGGMPAVDRIRLTKLAWDLAGDAFGQRLVQYERYHGGDPDQLLAGNYMGYDKTDCFDLVDRALALAGDPADSAPAPTPAS
jgi:anthranilate 3-monooxygenase (FAD) / 4-hydroxyphenylacetate 3-monooxygenase